jgi:Xaa-Pro aminopeptidase
MDLTKYRMIKQFEQVELFSAEEYERRLEGMITLMSANDLDRIYFAECSEEGYDRWLTGQELMRAIIVDSDGKLKLTDWSGKVNDIISALTGTKSGRLGIVNPRFMPAMVGDYLADQQISWKDVTIPTALFRAVKSDEEVAAAREAVRIQKNVFYSLPQIIRPGRNIDDVQQEISYLIAEQGGNDIIHAHLICNGPHDEPPDDFGGLHDHLITRNDRFFALIEANGPGYQHCAFGRHLCFGEPSASFSKAVKDAGKVHSYAVSMIKPGENLWEIAVKTANYAHSLGYQLKEQAGWNWMHGMGNYYYEQFALEDVTDRLPLENHIILHAHPLIYRTFPATDKKEEMFILNTYLITENGAEDLIGIPFNIVNLDD